jgi:phage gp29-like protein
MFKNLSALVSNTFDKLTKPDLDLQAGARSSNANLLNYRSVNTLDPARLASAFALADQGYLHDQAAFFELIEEQDPHIYAELAKRRRAVTGLGWHLQAPKDASQQELNRTAELNDMVRAIPRFEDAQYDLTDAIGKGFAALEIEWATGRQWLPKNLFYVPQRYFNVVRETGEMQYMDVGLPESLRPNGWIMHEHRAKSGYIEQASLFRVLAWTYAYKAYNMRDMQRFLEVYGLPLRLGKYPSGIAPKQRDELLRAVRNIGNDGAGVVPSTMSIDFISAQPGKVDDFLSTIQYWESKQSKAILGGELDGKTTSEARIMMYDKVRREILLHDVRQLEPTLNQQLIRPIVLFNGMFAADRMPVFKYETEESVDQQKMVDVLDKAAKMGMQIDVAWAHEALQIPRADDKALILGAAAPVVAAQDNAALTRLAALAVESVDAVTHNQIAREDQLSREAAPAWNAILNSIKTIVENATSLEGLRDDLLNSFADLDTAALTKVMALAFAAAELAGMDDVNNGD